MNRVSRRALVNFIVDSAIAAAFLVSAVSGLVFLVPGGWLSLMGSATTALGVSFATWRTLHDWSAVVMIAGVVLHTALHWRWVTTMVRRLAGGGRTQARPAAATAPVATGSLASASTPAVAGVERSSLTRHAFLKRAGAVAAAAVAGGLIGRSVAGTFLQDGTSTASGVATQASADDDGLGSADTDASSGGWQGSQSQQTPTQAARVVVDAGRCTGCGACLQVCPYGVFGTNGSVAAVANADACRLCGRCTQACRPGAITLNA